MASRGVFLRASSFCISVPIALSCFWLGGCASEPLDYQTALDLLRDQKLEALKITFSASPRLADTDPKIKEAYGQLIEGHVLDCQPNETVGTLCQPGSAGSAISAAGSTDLSLIAGHWVPSVITKINRSGIHGSTVEARFRFEPSPLYTEYQVAFDTLQSSADARVLLAQQKDGKNAQAVFLHSEEGWRLESLE